MKSLLTFGLVAIALFASGIKLAGAAPAHFIHLGSGNLEAAEPTPTFATDDLGVDAVSGSLETPWLQQ